MGPLPCPVSPRLCSRPSNTSRLSGVRHRRANFTKVKCSRWREPVGLSPSTEAYDRGRKFEHHRSVASLGEYLLVGSDRVHVDLYARQNGGQWLLSSVSGLEETIELKSVGCRLAISDLDEAGYGDQARAMTPFVFDQAQRAKVRTVF